MVSGIGASGEVALSYIYDGLAGHGSAGYGEGRKEDKLDKQDDVVGDLPPGKEKVFFLPQGPG